MISTCGLIPYPVDRAPSQRYRFEQWRPHLKAEGIEMKLFPSADDALLQMLYQPGRLARKAAALAKAFFSSAARLSAIRQYDVVLIHRAICIAGPALLERAATLFRRPIVFDFDDAIYR